ncbi:MAG: UbiA prenyltransferase family protein [Bacteroidia bacterium]|nr:UbiA prenyltransferase family protein [Bacteroidia bacterium]MDW8014585.1 UbiA prenyltransferase family protein [Bacteroidia bacterium]
MPYRQLLNWIRLLRPQQYVKNFFILPPMIFARRWDVVEETAIGFGLYCLTSSAVYAFNDAYDAPADRCHPYKRFRPIASGAIAPHSALAVAAFLAVGSILGGFLLKPLFAMILFLYLLNNLLYTLWLKRIALLDVFSIAAGFILRIYGGAVIGSIPVSTYLFMTVFFLSTFLAFGKRRHELLIVSPKEAPLNRKSLRLYSVYYLDQVMNISATLTLVVYVLYLMQNAFMWLLGTLPIVVMGLFRYYHLTHNKQGGEPTQELLTDRFLLVLGGLYGMLAMLEMMNVPFPL